MLSRLKVFAAASFALFLGACFLSERQLIGEGVRLQEGPLAFCMEPDEPCLEAVTREDGYLVMPLPEHADEEEPIFVRFAPLTRAGGADIWLGEAELTEDDDRAWAYVVARRAGRAENGVTEYKMAIPTCEEASDSQLIRYGLERNGLYACTVTNINAFAEYLTERHTADFADADWWDTAN